MSILHISIQGGDKNNKISNKLGDVAKLNCRFWCHRVTLDTLFFTHGMTQYVQCSECFCEIDSWSLFFDWTTGSASEFGSSLFSGLLSVGTLELAVCRTPDGTVGDWGI